MKIIQEKYLMTINFKNTVNNLILSMYLLFFITACTDNQNLKETTEKFESRFNDFPKLDSSQVRRIEKRFYNSGRLKKVAFFEGGQLQGYVKTFDSIGRLTRKSRYGWSGDTKNALVENIVYDSIGNIDYNKSFFLSTIPESVNDTIYFSIRETKFLNLKVKFYDSNLISSKVIIKYDNYSDTLNSFGDKWATHTFSRLNKGIINIYFGIEVRKSDSLVSIHESKRILKISE